jgi:hypothetical protein
MTGRNRAGHWLARPHFGVRAADPSSRDWTESGSCGTLFARMRRSTLAQLLAIAACGGTLVAACGGGGSPSSSTTGAPATTNTVQTGVGGTATTTSSSATTTTTSPSSPPASGTTAPSTGTPSTGATSGPISTKLPPRGTAPSEPTTVRVEPASPPDRERRVALCLETIANLSATTFTAPERAGLDHLCDVAGSGDEAKVRATERQICLTVVKDSLLPAAAAQAEAQSCKRPSRPTDA